MCGKAQHEPASTNQALGICIDYRHHLANMIKQNTVTQCPFLSLIYFTGYFQGIGIAGFLLSLKEHCVGKYGEDQSSTF